MALPVKYGDALSTPQLQPGWTMDSDGFGLYQSTCKFKWDGDAADAQFGNSKFRRGDEHPVYNNLYLYKAEYSNDKTNVATVTAEYCGIGASFNGGAYTYPRCSMVASSAAEDISHHPNFTTINLTSIAGGGVLAGPPPENGGFETDLTKNPNRAAWTPKSTNQGALQGSQFIGFLPVQKASDGTVNIKAGVKSYFKPTNTLRVITYYESVQDAMDTASLVGWVTGGNAFDLPAAWKNLAGDGYIGSLNYTGAWSGKIHKSFLVTNVSVELYGTIYKTTSDLMLSGMGGWDKDIYPYIS